MNLAGWAGVGWGEPAYGLSLVSGGDAAGARAAVGRLILVRTAPAGDGAAGGGVVISARVSRHAQRADLDRRVSRLTTRATDQDLTVRQGVVAVGSVLNGKRPKLPRICRTWMRRSLLWSIATGWHLAAVLSGQGRRVVVADPGEPTDDLVRHMIEVRTSICARLYGRRGAWAMHARAATKNGPGEAS